MIATGLDSIQKQVEHILHLSKDPQEKQLVIQSLRSVDEAIFDLMEKHLSAMDAPQRELVGKLFTQIQNLKTVFEPIQLKFFLNSESFI